MKMNGFGLHEWRPAYPTPPSIIPRRVGQATPASTTPPTPPAANLLDSPELAAASDFATSVASGFLAYNLGRVRNPASTFWVIVSVATGVKFLHDLSKF